VTFVLGHARAGSATFAVTPSESVISYQTSPDGSKPKVKAVAALLATSDSAIVTLASSGIDRPSKLDGKTYASYAARYEGRIVQQMIVADGGKGDYVESTPPMLGIWDTLLKVRHPFTFRAAVEQRLGAPSPSGRACGESNRAHVRAFTSSSTNPMRRRQAVACAEVPMQYM
jgi:hypothetical protein